MSQLALFENPQPTQLTLDYSTTSTNTATLNLNQTGPAAMATRKPSTLRRVLRWFAGRPQAPRPNVGNSGRIWILPSSTPDLTADDWRIIDYSLQTTIRDHTAADRWPAAEAAQRTLDKIRALLDVPR